MAQVNLQLHIRRRWWFGIAFRAVCLGCRLGLIPDGPHVDRIARWLAKHGLVFTINGRKL
ncbi:MAG: hypothetical protein ACK40O_00870 [Allosphingosinicella sp.]